MILHLKGNVGGKMIDALVEALNQLREKDNLAIYFSSNGGATDAAEVIIDIINKNIPHIGMIFYGDILSAGMEIFLRVKCEKHLLRDVRGMYHFSYQDISISEGGKPSGKSDAFYLKEMKNVKQRTLAFLGTVGVTQSEICRVGKGEDVYFNYERMQQLIDGPK